MIDSAFAVYEFAFGHLGFLASHFEVRKENLRVVAFHKRFGADVVNEDDLNYCFQLTLDSYRRSKQRYRSQVTFPALLLTAGSQVALGDP